MKRRTRGKGEGANDVDVQVGQRLRELRVLAGLSQSDLAATIGLTFQQLQKYERGANRISASKLYLLARNLNVPGAVRFADVDSVKLDDGTIAAPVALVGEVGEAQLRSREGLMLARHFMQIKEATTKAALKAFVEACAGLGVAEGGSAGECAGEGDGELGADRETSRRVRRPRGAVWHPGDIGAG